MAGSSHEAAGTMTAYQGVTGFDRRPRVSREGKSPSKRPSTTGIATSGTRVQFPAPPLKWDTDSGNRRLHLIFTDSVMVSHTLSKSHRWGVTLSKAESLDLCSESASLTQNPRFFVASLLRMTTDATYGLSKVLLPITEICRFTALDLTSPMG